MKRRTGASLCVPFMFLCTRNSYSELQVACVMIIGCVYFGTSLLYIILFLKILMRKLHFNSSQILEYVHSLHGLLVEIQDNAGYSISGNV
jgi:hypothetical protein